MKRAPLFVVLFGFLILFAGCKKQVSDADAIRAGINQHLSGLKTINLSAMDMTVNSFSIQGNQAQAQVEFRPKTGAPAGAGMQVNYTLEKQNGIWVVQNSQPAGGSIQHPAPGSDPHQTMTPGPSTQLRHEEPCRRDRAAADHQHRERRARLDLTPARDHADAAAARDLARAGRLRHRAHDHRIGAAVRAAGKYQGAVGCAQARLPQRRRCGLGRRVARIRRSRIAGPRPYHG